MILFVTVCDNHIDLRRVLFNEFCQITKFRELPGISVSWSICLQSSSSLSPTESFVECKMTILSGELVPSAPVTSILIAYQGVAFVKEQALTLQFKACQETVNNHYKITN